MRLLGVLLKPSDYVRVAHPAKRTLDVLSVCVGVICAAGLVWFRHSNVFAEYGLVHGMNGLFQALCGFYIAALAAIATFDGRGRGYDMDVSIEGDPATLIHDDGYEETLTRRRLLALLFGYLAGATLILYLSGVITMMLAPSLHDNVVEPLRSALKAVFVIPYVALLSHVYATTFLGLYFLAHRMMPSRPRLVINGTVGPAQRPKDVA